MNHVYKTVFNKSKQTWMAVCEYARRVGCGSASGGSKSVTRGVVGSMTFLSFAVLMALQSAHANTPPPSLQINLPIKPCSRLY